MNATLLMTLLLVNWLLVSTDRARERKLWKRYVVLGVVWIAYMIFVAIPLFFSAPTNNPNAFFVFAQRTAAEVVVYLLALVAPWGLDPTVQFVWLVAGLLLFSFFIGKTKSRFLIFLGIETIWVVLPLLPFLGSRGRYLYMPIMISAILLSGLVFLLVQATTKRTWRAVIAVVVAIVVVGNGWSIAEATEDYAAIVREHREPIRVASRSYPTVPNDMLFYFIDPPTDNAFLTGMFFLQYGRGVIVKTTETNAPAGLCDHVRAAVLYSAETAGVKAQDVNCSSSFKTIPDAPVNFGVPIRLEGYEVASPTVKKGEAIILLLYWHALGKVDQDYTVFVHLVNENGEIVAANDAQPQDAKSPTSSWHPNQWIIDPIIMPVLSNVAAESGYRLEVGLYYLPTMERALITDEHAMPVGDHLVIQSFSIGD